jgi:hypothetical protein
MVITCTPKQKGTVTQKQSSLEVTAMENPSETVAFEPTVVEKTSSEFIIEGTTLVKYNGNEGSVTIPSSVTEIDYNAFNGCINMTSVIIPTSVIIIKSAAFNNCENLKSVTFSSPSSVTEIWESAFSGCSSLTSIDIPSSVTGIGENAFMGCTNLTNITISHSTDVEYAYIPERIQINYRD